MPSLTDAIFHAYNKQHYPLCIERASSYLAHNPNDAHVWFVCAMSLYHLNDLPRAISYLEKARELLPDDEAIAINLAELLRKHHQLKRAALILAPFLPSTNPHIYFNLAKILSQAGDMPHAIEAYHRVLELAPNDMQAAYNLANLYAAQESYQQAITLYKSCNSLDAKFNLAHTYTMIDDLNSALHLYKELEEHFAPRLRHLHESDEEYKSYNIARADFYFNYANALRYAGKSREAERLYQTSHIIAPRLEYVLNYAHLLLSVGVWERGFSYYQERLKLPKQEMDNTRFFHSTKHIAILTEPAAIRECIKDARVLVFYEQGFGDSVMFARFIQELVCKEVYVFIQAPLKKLFKQVFCVVDEDFSDFDYCLSLPSLPYVLSIKSLQDFTHNASYLAHIFSSHPSALNDPPSQEIATNKPCSLDSTTHINHQEIYLSPPFSSSTPSSLPAHGISSPLYVNPSSSHYSSLHSAPLRIGIFFHSNPTFAYAKYKSIPLATLLTCFSSCANKGLCFSLHCIQPEPLASIASSIPITPLPSTLDALSTPAQNTQTTVLHTYTLHDFYDTARLIGAMDMVVSVDSVVAHLAIALRIPCVLLAHKRYDWRWGEIGRTRFQGYCGGEVIAQHRYGEWEEVLCELEDYLLRYKVTTSKQC